MVHIPISTQLHNCFNQLAQNRRMIFMTGLPGVGKSLLIQQLTLMATEAGRQVHLIQWDVARQAFETPEVMAKYPEIDGVTDPIIRQAVGMWSRQALVAWNEQFRQPEHLLIGEVPLLGNRLSELVAPLDDAAEALLRAKATEFVVPVPSREVRRIIESARAKTIANPQHEKESQDAPPNVLQQLWREVNELARQLNLTNARADAPYDPEIYGGVYDRLLMHRNRQLLLVDEALKPSGSVYESAVVTTPLAATEREVTQIINQIETTTSRAELVVAVEQWHASITER